MYSKREKKNGHKKFNVSLLILLYRVSILRYVSSAFFETWNPPQRETPSVLMLHGPSFVVQQNKVAGCHCASVIEKQTVIPLQDVTERAWHRLNGVYDDDILGSGLVGVRKRKQS